MELTIGYRGDIKELKNEHNFLEVKLPDCSSVLSIEGEINKSSGNVFYFGEGALMEFNLSNKISYVIKRKGDSLQFIYMRKEKYYRGHLPERRCRRMGWRRCLGMA